MPINSISVRMTDWSHYWRMQANNGKVSVSHARSLMCPDCVCQVFPKNLDSSGDHSDNTAAVCRAGEELIYMSEFNLSRESSEYNLPAYKKQRIKFRCEIRVLHGSRRRRRYIPVTKHPITRKRHVAFFQVSVSPLNL